MINLGKLKEIKDLRKVWPHEALDFTPWLAEEDNLTLLADAVGLAITVDETESGVGDFNVDIYATETGTDRKIIIENQQRLKQGIPATGRNNCPGLESLFFLSALIDLGIRDASGRGCGHVVIEKQERGYVIAEIL